MIKAERMYATNLKASYLTWDKSHVSSISEPGLDSLENTVGTIDDRVVSVLDTATYKPLICKCCGAPINRETMTCEYCGVQYGKGIDEHKYIPS